MKIEIKKIGNSEGLILPKELMQRLDLKRGQQLHIAELAAGYAFGLAKNHAFVDGNKRVAFMTMMTFLRKNGVRFAPDQARATTIIMALAAGEVSEESLARWIRDSWPKA